MSGFSAARTIALGRSSRELSRTTALALILALPGTAFADTIYWDVGDRTDGVIEGGSGSWGGFTQNWTEADGEGYAQFGDGDTVVFGTSETPDPTVNVIGTVRPEEIVMEGARYSFTGGRIGARNVETVVNTLQGASATFETEIAGDVSFTGAGRVTLDGTSRNLQSLTVGSGMAVETTQDARTSGVLRSYGNTRIEGLHDGDVATGSGGRLTLGTTGRVAGDLTNSGVTTVLGRVDDTLRNETGGRVILEDGARVGSVVNQSTIDLRGTSSVDDNFRTNAGSLLRVEAAQDARLNVGDGFFNDGLIQIDPTGTLAISADRINLGLNSDVSGNISFDGAVDNRGKLTLSGASALTDSLMNRMAGQLTIAADMDANGNAIQNRGTMSLGAGVTLADAGTLVNEGTLATGSGSVIDGNLRTSGDAVLAGDITGSLRDDGGTLTVAGPLTVGGDLRADGTDMIVTGDLGVGGTADLDGAVSGSGTIAANRLQNSGTVDLTGAGSMTVIDTFLNREDGVLNVAGAVTGDLVNAGDASVGTLTGAVANLEGATLAVAGVLTGSLQNAGEATLSGGVAGSVLNEDGGTLALGGDVTGDLLNEGTLDVTGAASVSGILQSTGQMTVTGTLAATRIDVAADAVLDAEGLLTTDIRNDGQVNLGQGLTGGLTNAGTVETAAGAVISGPVDNRDTLLAQGDLSMSGGVTNSGVLQTTGGRLSVAGGLVNNGLVHLGAGATGDTLVVDGGLSGAGQYVIGLSPQGGTSDQIVVTNGAITGTLDLRFALPQGEGFDVLRNPLLIIDADDTFAEANDYAFVYSGLPDPSESFVYSLGKQATGDLFLVGQVNPGIGALAGNVVLTESLIGTVINRPSSPFVVGRAYEDENACGPGAWARAVGGKATAQGGTTNGETRLNSEIDASYHGMQFGGDMACFNGLAGGWDMAVGVIGGINRGSTTQPVFAVNPENAEELTDIRTSTTDGEFDQMFGGVYLTASRGRFTSDLQIRASKTEYSVNNTPSAQGYAGLGLTDSEFEAQGRTISGSASYAFPLAAQGWSLVPTAGFAWNEVDVDTIRFDNGSSLEIKGADSRIGFAGATLSWTTVADSGISALNRFVTVTHYKDFADDIVSVYSMQGADGEIDSETLVSDNLGAYSELSLGVNYVRVLGAEDWGPGRQFNASVRVDGRSGSSLDSWGLTGQVRWQF